MKIEESLKDILEYDPLLDAICRKKVADKKQMKQEFRNILITNEGLTSENFNDKDWKAHDYVKPTDYGDNETYYCICSHKITVLYFIQNVKSGNVYQVGCDCVKKNISKELYEGLLKIRKEKEKNIKEIEKLKNDKKMYTEKLINFILKKRITKTYTYTIQDVINGNVKWRNIDEQKSHYLESGYVANPEIDGFMKSHYSHPREYVNNLDIVALERQIEQKNCNICKCPLKQSQKYTDCKAMYCPNYKSCKTWICGYQIDSNIGQYNCHPLVYYNNRIRYLKNKIAKK